MTLRKLNVVAGPDSVLCTFVGFAVGGFQTSGCLHIRVWHSVWRTILHQLTDWVIN